MPRQEKVPHLSVEGSLARVTPSSPETELTREQRRSRRKRTVRAKTISIKRLTKKEIASGRILLSESDAEEQRETRPATRAECVNGCRPCPFVSCKYHLYLDVSGKSGGVKINFPDLEVWEMSETCMLDVADRGGATLEEVGAIMNLTRERIRQVELGGLAKCQSSGVLSAWSAEGDKGSKSLRRLPLSQD